MDDLLTGPLTDVLPAPTTSPIPPQRPIAETAPLRPDDLRWGPEPGGGPLPRCSPPLLAITIPVSLAAAVLAVLPGQRAAHAEPCPPARPPAATVPRPPAPNPPAPNPPAPSPSASPPAAASGTGNPIGEFFKGVGDFVGDLFGGGQQAVEPTPDPSATPTASPTPSAVEPTPPTGPTRPAPVPTPCPSTSAPVPKPKQLAAAPGQPVVSKFSGRLTGTRVSMSGLSFDGVVELPTIDGIIRALQFSMGSSTTDNFKLVTSDGANHTISLTSSALTVEGNVKFYASRFTGKVFGLIERTFTPDSPPPLTLPEMFFTDPDIQLVFVDCDRLRAPELRITTP